MYRKILFVINVVAFVLTYYFISGKFVKSVYNELGLYTYASKVCIMYSGLILITGIVVVAGIDLSFAIRYMAGKE